MAQPRTSRLQPLVLVTASVTPGCEILAAPEPCSILTSLWHISADFDGWYVGDYLLMPGSVHLMARATEGAKPLHRWIDTWKELSARRLRKALDLHRAIWGAGAHVEFLRIGETCVTEWEYFAEEPVRAGLCPTPGAWQWKGQLFHVYD